MTVVSFVRFEPKHIDLLASWLTEDHVARWFPHPEDDIAWARDVPTYGRQFVVLVDERPAGYVRWSYVSREVLDSVGFQDIPNDAADIDLLLGDANLVGRGIAAKIFEFALATMQQEGIATLAALTSSIDNVRAHKAFQPAGFEVDREYVPEGFGRCYLMLRSVVG